jgi:hypothetical protein
MVNEKRQYLKDRTEAISHNHAPAPLTIAAFNLAKCQDPSSQAQLVTSAGVAIFDLWKTM